MRRSFLVDLSILLLLLLLLFLLLLLLLLLFLLDYLLMSEVPISFALKGVKKWTKSWLSWLFKVFQTVSSAPFSFVFAVFLFAFRTLVSIVHRGLHRCDMYRKPVLLLLVRLLLLLLLLLIPINYILQFLPETLNFFFETLKQSSASLSFSHPRAHNNLATTKEDEDELSWNRTARYCFAELQ